ncbi:AMP-binding protein [Longispora albida]|uniref:AMP-binding protein n=1 Tax=Longispora albida TaxID=203523 RepID=UPI0003757077|nr:AMP-binding protein [Longispora albida]
MTPVGTLAKLGYAFARSGLLKPSRPDRIARQVGALLHWGLSLAGEFVSAARRDPGRIAIVDDAGQLTFAEVDQRTDRMALAFAVHGRPRIGLLCRNHRGAVETLIAASKLGSDVVLLNTGLSAAQLATVLDQQQVDVVVLDEEFAGLLGDSVLPRYLAWAEGGASDLESLATTPGGGELSPPEQPGRTIILTSGTTGAPKGARRPVVHGVRPLAAMLSRIPLKVGGRVLIAAPIFHTWGFGGLQFATAMRSTLVLRRKFEPAAINELLAAEKCTALWAVPIMLQRLLDEAAPPRVPELRVTAVSGSTLPGDLALSFMDAYGDVLYNLYGSTEASWAAVAQPHELRAYPGTAGRPPAGTRLVIFSEDGEPVRPGETGQIFVGNEMIFDGYTNGAAKEIRDGMLRTGDLGHLEAGGLLFVDGREDDMIISGGENVFPREVEDLLSRLPEVLECCVAGVDDPEWGQRLAAWVVLHPGAELDAEAVRQHVKEHLARFSVPRDVRFLDALPRNATGKVLVRDLPR